MCWGNSWNMSMSRRRSRSCIGSWSGIKSKSASGCRMEVGGIVGLVVGEEMRVGVRVSLKV